MNQAKRPPVGLMPTERIDYTPIDARKPLRLPATQGRQQRIAGAVGGRRFAQDAQAVELDTQLLRGSVRVRKPFRVRRHQALPWPRRASSSSRSTRRRTLPIGVLGSGSLRNSTCLGTL